MYWLPPVWGVGREGREKDGRERWRNVGVREKPSQVASCASSDPLLYGLLDDAAASRTTWPGLH